MNANEVARIASMHFHHIRINIYNDTVKHCFVEDTFRTFMPRGNYFVIGSNE